MRSSAEVEPGGTPERHDSALRKQIIASLKDSTKLYKKYTEDKAFQGDLNDVIFKLTYRPDRQD